MSILLCFISNLFFTMALWCQGKWHGEGGDGLPDGLFSLESEISVSKLRPKCVNTFGASTNPWMETLPRVASLTSLMPQPHLDPDHHRSPVGLCTMLSSHPQTWSLDAPAWCPLCGSLSWFWVGNVALGEGWSVSLTCGESLATSA